MHSAQAVRDLEAGLNDALEQGLSGKVVPLQRRTRQSKARHPETEADKLAAAHRKAVALRQQRIADTKKGLKATLATIADDRKEAKARYEAEMAELAEREALAKEQAAEDIAADQRIVASCQAALEALTAE